MCSLIFIIVLSYSNVQIERFIIARLCLIKKDFRELFLKVFNLVRSELNKMDKNRYGPRFGGNFGNRHGFGNRQSFAPVKEGEEIDVKIESVGSKGDGIAKVKGFVLFIPGAKEGEEVKVKVTRVLRKVGFAEIVGQAESKPVAEDSESFGEEENVESEELQEESTEEENVESEEPQEESTEEENVESEEPQEESTEEEKAESEEPQEESTEEEKAD